MWSALDSLMICTRFVMVNFIEDFKKDERGVAPIVATILLIVMVVGLAAMFWESLSAWFVEMWNKILGKTTGIG